MTNNKNQTKDDKGKYAYPRSPISSHPAACKKAIAEFTHAAPVCHIIVIYLN